MGKKFSELERAVSLNNGDLAAFAQVDRSAATGYKSKAAPMSLVSQKILKDTEYASDLQTNDKTVLGAINEVNSRTIAYDVVSGPIVNFKTSLELPIKSLGIDVNAAQDAGTPTPASPLPISGWSEITLKHSRKNFVDDSHINDKNFWESIEYDTFIFPLDLPKNATLTISGQHTVPSGLTPYVYLYEKQPDGTWKSIMNFWQAQQNLLPRSFITKDTEYRLWAYNAVASINTIDWLQIEAGTSASDYEQYSEPVTEVISLGGTYYGGHFTQDKDGRRQFIVEELSKRINEFEGWYYIGGYNYFECTVENMKGSAATSVLNGLICECYTARTAQQAGSGNVDDSIAGWTYTTTNESRLRIKDNDFDNVSNWLNSVGNYLVVYPLETPIIIDLPDGDPIITFNGINNIYADSGDASVEYALTIEEYIDKKIASVQALILNS